MKPPHILVGDDSFLEPYVGMAWRDEYVPTIIEQLKVLGYDTTIQSVKKPEDVVANAPEADVVVTDLDYTGHARGTEGYDVVDAVSQLNPKPLLILCTSSDDQQEIKARTDGKIDYQAGHLNKGHKFDELVEVLINHYK
jgi:DNA-binding NarL/FixJ family response regulator